MLFRQMLPDRRGYAPGQHGQSRKKVSEYGLQLRMKQKARRYYGVLESQFHHYFEMAERKTGVTGEKPAPSAREPS